MTFHARIYLAALLAALPLAAKQRYQITKFYVPGPPHQYPYTSAQGINIGGMTVGFYSTAVGEFTFNKGFIRNPDGTLVYPISDPNDPKGQNTYLWGINDAGTIAGYYFGTVEHGFLYNNGNFTDISEIENGNTRLYSVNNNGDFAGALGDQDPPQHGFVSVGGAVTQFDVPGAGPTWVMSLADDGSSCGVAFASGTGNNIAFVRSASGKIHTFQAKNASPAGSWATGINSEAKLIVGFYYDTAGRVHGFVLHYTGSLDDEGVFGPSNQSPSGAPARLNVAEIQAGQSGDVYINGVNANGIITGYAQPGLLNTAIGFIGTPIQ